MEGRSYENKLSFSVTKITVMVHYFGNQSFREAWKFNKKPFCLFRKTLKLFMINTCDCRILDYSYSSLATYNIIFICYTI